MKKLIVPCLLLTASLASAQLTVVNNNHIEIGTASTNTPPPIYPSAQNSANAIIVPNPITKVQTDSLASSLPNPLNVCNDGSLTIVSPKTTLEQGTVLTGGITLTK